MDQCHLDQAKTLTPVQGADPASSPRTQMRTNNKAALQMNAGACAIVMPRGKKVQHKAIFEIHKGSSNGMVTLGLPVWDFCVKYYNMV